ncbi:TetR/AcrR family transcriptional regulator [Nonomuraea sp. MCN248]|uniref:TetR/AcrR family transcriptional regulator n=1 Tax=Nonomuraea corallina TaxID=2989783 RepID=A0ABT4S5U9_9ACTN|nr:TetR/AcrR family transcriptional regulator [Nonomuraea corallina]MDA0632578.1 TetR/AcrR family transcriptional regulator [Nonomuraea corallina]
MPKKVDHEQRRTRIAEALWGIAASRGLEAVSMREVATAAGMSIGLVQHYFASKDEMLLYATVLLRDRLSERLRHGLAGMESAAPRDVLRALLVTLLPLDAEARTETLVGVAVFIRALNDETLAARYREGQTRLAAAVAGCLQGLTTDPGTAADTLLALVDGLASGLLLGHHTPEHAISILDRQISQMTESSVRLTE